MCNDCCLIVCLSTMLQWPLYNFYDYVQCPMYNCTNRYNAIIINVIIQQNTIEDIFIRFKYILKINLRYKNFLIAPPPIYNNFILFFQNILIYYQNKFIKISTCIYF